MARSSKLTARQRIFNVYRLVIGSATNLRDGSPLLARYLSAVLCVVGAVLVGFALAPVLAKEQVLFSFTIAITLAALTAGTGPGLFATALSVIAAWFFFLEPYFSFALSNIATAASLVVLGGVGVSISVMCRFFRSQGGSPEVLTPVMGLPFIRRAVLVGVAIVTIGALTQVLKDDFDRQRELQGWVDHTYQVLIAAQNTLSNLEDAETGLRGFLLTGEDRYLAPFEEAQKRKPSLFQQLRDLTADNPAQVARVQQLNPLIDSKYLALRSALAIRRNEGFAPSVAMIRRGSGLRMMDEARAILAEVDAEERHLLGARIEKSQAQSTHLHWMLAMGSVSLLMLLLIAAAFIERDIRDREHSSRELDAAHQKTVAMLESISDGFQALDHDWRYTYVNAAAARMLGKTPEQLLGRIVWDVWPHFSESVFGACSRQATEENVPVRFEGFYGEPLNAWFDVRCYPAPDGLSLFFTDTTETRHLQEQMSFLQSAVLQIAEGILIMKTGDGQCEAQPIFVNSAFEKMTGYNISELQTIVGPLQYDFAANHNLIKLLRMSCGRGCPQHFENRVARKDGSEFWAEFAVKPLTDKKGDCTHCVWTCRDITARKRASEQSRLLASIVESSDDAIVSEDLDGKVLSWNAGAERLYGYSSNEMLGQSLTRLLLPDHPAEVLEILEHIKSARRIEHMETERIRKDGQRIFVSLTISPLQDDSGAIVGAAAVSRDITERRRAAKALELSELRYRSLVRAVSEIIWVANAEGQLVEDSPSWREFTGQSFDDFRGSGWLNCLFPDDRALTEDQMSRAIRSGSTFESRYRLRRRDGEYRWMAVHGVSVPCDDGQIQEWVGICTDIHDRMVAEKEVLRLNQDLEARVAERTAELKAANKELESFAYSVSHDLRAPLRAVDGFSRILLEEHAAQLSSEVQRYLGLVRSNAVQMGNLIDGLLAFSRLGRQVLNKQTVATGELVRQALSNLASDQEGRPLEISIEDLPPCEGDPLLLRQVFTNLLSNALKYTRRCAWARIRVGSFQSGEIAPQVEAFKSAVPRDIPAGSIIYYIRDNGAGFDMRYAGKLFGVFQRLHSAEEYEGTGVGLATVLRIVTRHGGRIWADAALNAGATFYFTLSSDGKASPAAGSEVPGLDEESPVELLAMNSLPETNTIQHQN